MIHKYGKVIVKAIFLYATQITVKIKQVIERKHISPEIERNYKNAFLYSVR